MNYFIIFENANPLRSKTIISNQYLIPFKKRTLKSRTLELERNVWMILYLSHFCMSQLQYNTAICYHFVSQYFSAQTSKLPRVSLFRYLHSNNCKLQPALSEIMINSMFCILFLKFIKVHYVKSNSYCDIAFVSNQVDRRYSEKA